MQSQNRPYLIDLINYLTMLFICIEDAISPKCILRNGSVDEKSLKFLVYSEIDEFQSKNSKKRCNFNIEFIFVFFYNVISFNSWFSLQKLKNWYSTFSSWIQASYFFLIFPHFFSFIHVPICYSFSHSIVYKILFMI